jgi:hypothetical protein
MLEMRLSYSASICVAMYASSNAPWLHRPIAGMKSSPAHEEQRWAMLPNPAVADDKAEVPNA